MLRPDGSLDRPRLGDIVFADPELRAKLNAIVHPLVGARMTELERAAGTAGIVVHDVPLITENGLASTYDIVVVVDAPRRVQADRLVRHRGMTREQATARIAAQATRKQRLAIAGIVDRQLRLAGRARPPGRRAVGRAAADGAARPATDRRRQCPLNKPMAVTSRDRCR